MKKCLNTVDLTQPALTPHLRDSPQHLFPVVARALPARLWERDLAPLSLTLRKSSSSWSQNLSPWACWALVLVSLHIHRNTEKPNPFQACSHPPTSSKHFPKWHPAFLWPLHLCTKNVLPTMGSLCHCLHEEFPDHSLSSSI